jgi:hypothetical protein
MHIKMFSNQQELQALGGGHESWIRNGKFCGISEKKFKSKVLGLIFLLADEWVQ